MRKKSTVRFALASILTVLIGTGFALQFAFDAAISASATSTPTPSQAPSSAAPSGTPTPSAPAKPVDPVLESVNAAQNKAGCHFNLVADSSAKALGTCKVLLIGDSIGNNLGYGMLGQLKRIPTLKFAIRAKASTGLSNSWFYNWETNLKSMLRTEKPNLVIVLLGANDRQNIKVGSKIFTYGSASWKSVYMQSVGRITKLANDSGAYVMWFGMPKCKPYNYNAGMELMAKLYRGELAKHPAARFVDLNKLTSDAAGNYTQFLTVNGVQTKVRGDDGIHFTAAGQNVIGSYAIEKVATLLKVPLRSSFPRVVTK